MNFRPELAAKVMAGEKTVTRRLVSDNPRSPWFIERCGLRPGKTYAVCPGRGKDAIGRVVVDAVMSEPLGRISDSEARREGFANAAEFEAAFAAINGGYDPHVIVWRVVFRVDKTALRAVHGWHTECSACGYGGGGWTASPALEGKPIITPTSEECPGCGARFVGNDDRFVTRYAAKSEAA